MPIAASSSASAVTSCGQFGPPVMLAEKLAPSVSEISWGELFGARPKCHSRKLGFECRV